MIQSLILSLDLPIKVTLTDVEGPVLTNLLHCVALNIAQSGESTNSSAATSAHQEREKGTTQKSDSYQVGHILGVPPKHFMICEACMSLS